MIHPLCWTLSTFFLLVLVPCPTRAAEDGKGLDLSTWVREHPDVPGLTIAASKATLVSKNDWAYLLNNEAVADGEMAATVTIMEPATNFFFFGQGWSAWPNLTWNDHGFEAALLLRADKVPLIPPAGIPASALKPRPCGYRVQLSHKYQEIALYKYPTGGCVQSVPCEIKLKHPHRLAISVRGNQISVRVDGLEKINYQDNVEPLEKGRFGVSVSSGAKVVVEDVALVSKPAAPRAQPATAKHEPKFAVRKWLGGRQWVFDGNEPILQVPFQENPSRDGIYFGQTVHNVKLLPGYRPMLSWNGHWDIANQGAFPAGRSKATDPQVTGGGPTVTIAWTGKQFEGRFTTRTKLVVGFDAHRGTYTYDVDTTLEVLAEMQFRYGFDFEHHQVLDPFNRQYLLFKGADGTLYRRPVYTIDPGPQHDLMQKNGLRVWYGRHTDKMVVAPAVEYNIVDAGKRKVSTAVCAAFYDTGFGFEPEIAKPGTKLHVNYRYTGYPAAEVESLFKESVIYPSPMLDPHQHYIFTADQWPKLTFNNFAPMSETWLYGRRPFITRFNQRPPYELAKNTGVGSGFAMKLGPGAYGSAPMPIPTPFPTGSWLLTALCRSDNAHGPGGRIELKLTAPKANKELKHETHYVGNGSFDWKKIGFVFKAPANVGGLEIAFGNDGTGNVYFTDVGFEHLDDKTALPAWVSAQANATAPKLKASPEGAIADYRMEEGKDLHVYDYARGKIGMMELANLDWVMDEGRPALKFADNKSGRMELPGTLDRAIFSRPTMREKRTVPMALAGALWRGRIELKAFTLASWVKPAAKMVEGDKMARADVIGLGSRSCIVSLYGRTAPYKLGAALNVGEQFMADTKLDADQWYHIALTAEPTADQKWQVRLYLDGKLVHEGVTKTMKSPTAVGPHVVFGTELYYLHSSYYRGLIGRTLVFDRALSGEQIADLARQ